MITAVDLESILILILQNLLMSQVPRANSSVIWDGTDDLLANTRSNAMILFDSFKVKPRDLEINQ